jgi:hypothetical protein
MGITFEKVTLGNGKPGLKVLGLPGGAIAFVFVREEAREAAHLGTHAEIRIAVFAWLVDAQGENVLDKDGHALMSEGRRSMHTDSVSIAEAVQMAVDQAVRQAVAA